MCEVGQSNWEQTAPANTICAADPFGDGLAPGGYAITVQSGGVDNDNHFGNTPLSDFDVRFFDLTGSTDATISCAKGTADVPGTAGGTPGPSSTVPETTETVTGAKIGTYVCTITITDP